MSDNPLRQPGGQGDMFDAHQFRGHLLLIYCKGYNPLTKTSKGVGPGADCDVIVVTAKDPATSMPVFFENARLFGNLGKSAGEDRVNDYTLGWLDQVPTAGGHEAWILKDAVGNEGQQTPEQAQAVAQAMPWYEAHRQKRFRAAMGSAAVGPSPATTPPPPSAGPAGPAQGWRQDAWAGMNAAPPVSPVAPMAAPAPAPSTSTPSTSNDPNIAALINKGVDPTVVMNMDPATRAAVLATYGG